MKTTAVGKKRECAASGDSCYVMHTPLNRNHDQRVWRGRCDAVKQKTLELG